MTATQHRTVTDLLVLAADRTFGGAEFTEWELSEAAWKADPARFGMRDLPYPDHNRLKCELVKTRTRSVLGIGYLERVRPNTYRLTEAGRLAAARLRKGEARDVRPTTTADLWRVIRPWVTHLAFAAWRADPAQPKRWPAGEGKPGPDLTAALEAASAYCRTEGLVEFGRPAVPVGVLGELWDFCSAMTHRFGS